MPVFLAALLGGLWSVMGSLVGQVLLSLGVGFVAYTGIDVAMTGFKSLFISSAGGLGSDIAGFLGLMHIGAGVNILLSSIAVRLTITGLTSGTLKRMVFK